ncbi:unnamed protein product [Polarella glacialis]|uniref:Amino acid transporter transmembrane domain-containing protein n=1 Tax=Polarella glacialis TaxID=89957 RepID=A0A813FIG1_POLGL|nr:unnamed protein product [Polarella glacialis]CAE8614243.1 unnamed protein product [Polarella glacialis]
MSSMVPLSPDFSVQNAALCSDQSRATGKMSFRSAVFNLTNTIIGAGTLTMPFVFAQVGWLAANAICLLIVMLNLYGVHLLCAASDRVGGEGVYSFEALGYRTCGELGSIYAELSFIIGGLGTLTGYMIFIGSLLTQVAGLAQDQAYIPIIGVMVFVIAPLTWQRSINALRHASLVAFLAIMYVTCMLVVFWDQIGEYKDDPSQKYVYKEVQVAVWTAQSIKSVNLSIGAFGVMNTCLPVYGELAVQSSRRIIGAIVCAMLLSAIVYEAIGMSGYFLFGGNLFGNVLLNFDASFVQAHPWTQVPCRVAKIAMALILSLSLPLSLWPARSAVCSVLFRLSSSGRSPDQGGAAASDALFRAVTFGILITVTILAIQIPDVTIPLGLVNSLAGGSMLFIMPGLFFLFSIEDRAERYSFVHWRVYAFIVLGIFVSILGFSLQLRSVIT